MTSSATNPVFTFTNAAPAGYPIVTLQASNLYGSVTVTNTSITVLAAPTNAAYFVTSTGATNVLAGVPVTFLNLGAGVTNYYWTFGDGGWSTSASPTHTYVNAGTYAVWLTVNGRTSYMMNIYVYLKPTAAFTAGPTNGPAPLAVSFTNTSANAAAYLWTFQLTSSNVWTSATTNSVFSFTFTNGAALGYPAPVVTLQASNPGGSATVTNTSIRVN